MFTRLKGLAPRRGAARGSGEATRLAPLLVDCAGRDGSTLMMRLLATSPQISVPGPYPYEKKYFAYLWRWSRLLERADRNDLWTYRDLASLAQEANKPFMGRPPWRSSLLVAGGGQSPMSRRMFDVAWEEFSRRAAAQLRAERGDPAAEVRYYAEKHQETWLVDLDDLPPLQVLVLLRDPRDTYVSFHAFDAKRRRAGTGRFEAALPGHGETPDDRTTRFIERERRRLRWIAGLPGGHDFPVFRYEDMVTDLPGQARRLQDWLSVSLDPEAAAGDPQMRNVHVSAQTPEASVGRWRTELRPEVAERFNVELAEELAALGYDVPTPGPRRENPPPNSRQPQTPPGILRSPVEDQGMETNPRVPDFGGWYSLANLREILFPCLEAVGPKHLLEVGAYRGELTRELLEWAATGGTRVTAVDPAPQAELLQLAEQHSELELVVETSHDALQHVSMPDAVILDGDHNYFTLSGELRLIAERAQGADLPLLTFHDVGWPHARRDSYCEPERIPEEHRQPLARNIALAPWEPGVAPGGLPFEWAAEREGGPRNGVLTALEDFVEESQGLRLAIVPAFFGFGVVWHEDAPWANAVASIVEPWDRNPLLERLEANRVAQLAGRHALAVQLEEARGRIAKRAQRLHDQAQRLGEQERVLRSMLGSRAFAVAEHLSRVHQRGRAVFSRQQVRRALGDTDGAAPEADTDADRN